MACTNFSTKGLIVRAHWENAEQYTGSYTEKGHMSYTRSYTEKGHMSYTRSYTEKGHMSVMLLCKECFY